MWVKEPNIAYPCWLSKTHPAWGLHAEMHCHEPQTGSHLDTYPVGAANETAPLYWSYVGISHIDHCQWDTQQNLRYTWLCSLLGNQPCIPLPLTGILSLSVDTKIGWLHQSKKACHEALELLYLLYSLYLLYPLSLGNPIEPTVYLGQSTSWQRKSIVPVVQILHLL